MHPNIARLAAIAAKKERLIVGLMSGTSLDGLDVAVCRFRGSGAATEAELLAFETVVFDEAFKSSVRRVFAKKQVDFEHLTLLNAEIGAFHGQLVLKVLAEKGFVPSEIDLVASHGQTVFHAPKILHGLADRPNATLQIGDGDHVAATTGIVTLSDFRQKHVAAGGEGAPLALYGDFLLFAERGENRVLINLGGIANFTWLPATGAAATVFATDTGPGNGLLDQTMQHFLQKPFDQNGEWAAKGRVSEPFLQALLAEPFFEKPFPKTTGPELFNLDFVEKSLEKANRKSLELPDRMATLAELTARSLADAIKKAASSRGLLPVDLRVFLSGGGAHNPVIVAALRRHLPGARMEKMAALGIDGDAKEAVLFAALANEAVAGSGENFGFVGQPNVAMGKVSFPF